MKQCTLKSAFTIKGKGLHTGREIEATFKPAPDNFGRKFLRIDVEGAAPIEAVAENVVETCRGTVIASGDLKISTIEHAMAALYASNVDNCLVELNGPEVPILDGSAKIFMDKIEEVGVVEQTEDAAVYVVRNRTTVKDSETEASICVIPDSDFCVDVMIEFNSVVLSNQFATLDSLDDFKTQIAASRTFVFVREIEELVKHDLIKGGDLDNAIVIYDTPVAQSELDRIADMMNVPRKKVSEFGFINSDELVFKNEPARHKLLDVVGDVALIGRRVQGRIIATCPGHTINTTFAKKVRRELKRQEVQAPVYNPNEAPIMDVNRIRELLPHRYPFLLVDKIIDKSDKYIVGVKNVSGNEPFFQGHFPTEPVMPGVLQVEAMAQTAGLLVLGSVDNPESYSTYFMKIDNVKFRQKVVPGDTLIFHVSFLTEMRRGCANMKGYAFVGDKIVSEAEFMAQIIKNKYMKQPLAYIHPDAKIDPSVVIDPFVTIDRNVEIGAGTRIASNVTIMEGARIGKNCSIFPGAVIGAIPQDLKFMGENTLAIVGDNTTIRECVTINRGTASKGKTVVGSNCLIMAYSHIAHDCVIGDNIIIANASHIAGEVQIDNFAVVGGGTLIHQFCHIGSHVMIQGGALVNKDIPPYVKAAREPISYAGVNSIGLRRRGFTNEQIRDIQDIYRYLYLSGYNNSDAVEHIEAELPATKERDEIILFVRNSKRGIIKGYV